MRELGVIYNSSYYSISEHPGYQRAGDNVEVSTSNSGTSLDLNLMLV